MSYEAHGFIFIFIYTVSKFSPLILLEGYQSLEKQMCDRPGHPGVLKNSSSKYSTIVMCERFCDDASNDVFFPSAITMD